MSQIENKYINRAKDLVDEISNYYFYDNNTRHLLYVVVPSFLSYYGLGKEKIIRDVFKKIPIIYKDLDGPLASFNKSYQGNEFKGVIYISKRISSISDKLDQMIHEYNHAINSYNKPLINGALRTGLSLTKNGVKDNKYIFEEAINTYQSASILEYIKSFDLNNIESAEIANTIYTIKKEHPDRFISKGYSFYTELLYPILSNKSFMLTLEDIRFTGELNDFLTYFESIMGPNTYEAFNDELIALNKDIYNYSKAKIFKKRKLLEVRRSINEVKHYINLFINNKIY